MDLSNFGVEVKKQGNDEEEGTNLEKKSQEIDINNKIKDPNLDFSFNDEIKNSFQNTEIERFLPWFLKYQVKHFDDLIITKEIKKIIDFVENKPKGKGLLLVGRAGSGKTTTLNLLGEKYDFEIFEMNASNSRNKKSIEESIGDVIKQKSLFGKRKLILVDEVDGLSGTKDRGGIPQIIKYIKNTNQYIVFTGNDADSNSIKALKKVCITIDFENHSSELLLNIAKRIFKKEGIDYDEKELLKFIEKRSTIDIRGFINDLQASVINSKFELDDNLELRNYKKKIELVLEKIFYSYPEDSLVSSFNSDINLDDLFLYLEENIPNVYEDKSLILAFNELSKADVFRGRIRKWQYWRFLVYVNFYLSFGVSNSKGNSKSGFNVKKITDFKRNDRILKKWIYGNKYNSLRSRTNLEKKKEVEPKFIEKLAKYYGISAKKCRSNDLWFFVISYRNNENFQKEMDELFEIDDGLKKVLLEL